MSKTLIPVIIISLFSIFLLRNSFVVQGADNVCFCHNILNNPVTVCTDNQGLINGHTGHVNDGSDTFGACVGDTPTVTPTGDPSVSPTVTPTVTIEEPTVTPTSTPSPTNSPTPTVTPTNTPSPTNTPTPTNSPTPTNTPTPTITPSVTPKPVLACSLPTLNSSILGTSGINIVNINLMCVQQTSNSSMNTGGNGTAGNIGGGGIQTSGAQNTSGQGAGGNTNTTSVTANRAPVTNRTTIFNSGINALFNMFASSNN